MHILPTHIYYTHTHIHLHFVNFILNTVQILRGKRVLKLSVPLFVADKYSQTKKVSNLLIVYTVDPQKKSHVTRMEKSCHTNKQVMAHIRRSHVTTKKINVCSWLFWGVKISSYLQPIPPELIFSTLETEARSQSLWSLFTKTWQKRPTSFSFELCKELGKIISNNFWRWAAQEWTNCTLIGNEPLMCSKMCFAKTKLVQ